MIDQWISFSPLVLLKLRDGGSNHIHQFDATTPKIALRQIFGRLGVAQGLCEAAADAGLLSVEIVAMLGDTAAAAKDQIKALTPEDQLGDSEILKPNEISRQCSSQQSGKHARPFRRSSHLGGHVWRKIPTRYRRWLKKIMLNSGRGSFAPPPRCSALGFQRATQEVR